MRKDAFKTRWKCTNKTTTFCSTQLLCNQCFLTTFYFTIINNCIGCNCLLLLLLRISEIYRDVIRLICLFCKIFFSCFWFSIASVFALRPTILVDYKRTSQYKWIDILIQYYREVLRLIKMPFPIFNLITCLTNRKTTHIISSNLKKVNILSSNWMLVYKLHNTNWKLR